MYFKSFITFKNSVSKDISSDIKDVILLKSVHRNIPDIKKATSPSLTQNIHVPETLSPPVEKKLDQAVEDSMIIEAVFMYYLPFQAHKDLARAVEKLESSSKMRLKTAQDKVKALEEQNAELKKELEELLNKNVYFSLML